MRRHFRAAVGIILLLLTYAEHVDLIARNSAALGKVADWLLSINWSSGSWVVALVGVALVASDWVPKEKWPEILSWNKYILASEALDYIALDSHWSKLPRTLVPQALAGEEFRRMAELGEVASKGIRRLGQFNLDWQEIPPSHWTVASLAVPITWSAPPAWRGASVIRDAHLSTELLSLASAVVDKEGKAVSLPGAWYADVQVRRRDVRRVWPKDRWWHKASRAIASQK